MIKSRNAKKGEVCDICGQKPKGSPEIVECTCGRKVCCDCTILVHRDNGYGPYADVRCKACT